MAKKDVNRLKIMLTVTKLVTKSKTLALDLDTLTLPKCHCLTSKGT